MSVVECDVPATSVLGRHLIEAAYFRDAYSTSLSHSHKDIVDIFLAIFAHHPLWMKLALIARHRIVACFGLDVPSTSEVVRFKIKGSYNVGDKIGVWPIFALTESELVAGRDNKHLDFRLSVLRAFEGESANVTVSTICTTHNIFGKLYLFIIAPFHKWGVKRLISNAIVAGRL